MHFFNKTKFSVVVLAVYFIGFCPAVAFCDPSAAQNMVSLAPDNLLGFFAASGTDERKTDFEKTPMGRIWNDRAFQNFVETLKNEMQKTINAQMQNAGEVQIPESLIDLPKQILTRPFIAGVAQIPDKNDEIPVYGFLIIDAGSSKDQFAQNIAKLEAMDDVNEIEEKTIAGFEMKTIKKSSEGDPRVYWGWIENYFVLAVNDNEAAAVKYLAAKDISRKQPDYFANVKGTNDAFVIYYDFERVASLVKTAIIENDGGEAIPKITAGLSKLGFLNVKSICARAGFSESQMFCSEQLKLSGAPKGLLAGFKPVDPAVLDMVSSKAIIASAINYDFAGAYDIVMDTIKTTSPNEVYPEITENLSYAENQLNFSIRNDFLQSLSGQMVYYTIPQDPSAEIYQAGVVMIAKLRDKARFEKTMTALEKLAAVKCDNQIQITTQDIEGSTFRIIGFMPLTLAQVVPAWTIIDDHLIFASDIKICSLAARQLTSGENSIRTTEAYKNTVRDLPANLVSINYVDSRAQFNQIMMNLQKVWPMITMTLSQQGIRLPFMIPDLSHIIKDMKPGFSYCTVDNNGFRSYYRGSGIELTAKSIVVPAVVTMASAFVMPAMAKTRDISQRIVAGSNLTGIGKACWVYAQDNEQKFPPDLQALVDEADLSPKMLKSPRKPKNFKGPDFIYIEGNTATSPPTNVVAYENPAFCKDEINVLYADTHVKATDKQTLLKDLQRTYKQLGKPMPDFKWTLYD